MSVNLENSTEMRIIMHYNLLELMVLIFCYSFFGWLIETTVATIKNKTYGNRGFVSGPFCFIYGFSAIFMSIFLRELKSTPVFLFLGTSIVATVIEWITGKAFERIQKERWWNYSHKKWNIDGYICLQYSLLWGILGCIAIYWTNDLILALLKLLPDFLLHLIIWGLIAINILDMIASILTLNHHEKKSSKLIHWNKKLGHWTTQFGCSVTAHIQKRIDKAYPAIHSDLEQTSTEEKLSLSEFVWLFVIGAFLGDIVETIFCRITTGVWMSRSSLVWGPFSIVWGLALALVTALLYKSKDKPDRYLFVTGTLLGGAYEYICSVFTEIVFGKIFWDYSDIPFNLAGRINLLYCFFWGIAAVVWFKIIYPKFNVLISLIIQKTGKWLTILCVLFMVADISVSILALVRYDAREKGVNAVQVWERSIDRHFPDERMKQIYPNAK